MAIVTAIARQDREHGPALAAILTANFAITLSINLVITGVTVGLVFALLVNRLFGRA